MFPLQDMNPTRRTPILTWVLIGINVLVFLWESSLPAEELQRVFSDWSVVPANVTANPFSLETLLDMIRSMFFHGGWAHLGGNMLYLYLFGDNIEDRFGRILYLAMYFISGFVASIAQILIDPNSQIPLVGASGAIAGVLGSYLVLFPRVKVRGIIPIGRVSTMQEWPAFAVLAMWFGLQLINGVASLGAPNAEGGGVAFFAHIGGFVAGAIIAFVLMRIVPQPPPEERRQVLYERTQRYPF